MIEVAVAQTATGVDLLSPALVWRSVGSLAVVLGALVVFLWLLKRFTPLAGHESLHLVAALSIGPRERLLLIEVQGERLLIGATPQHIQLIHHFSAAVSPPFTVPDPLRDPPLAGDQ